MLFTADDNQNGREVWKSDGTLEGTEMVADIRPGDRFLAQPCPGADRIWGLRVLRGE